MKKLKFAMLAAILTFCGATMTLTSCHEDNDDTVVPTPSEEFTIDDLRAYLVGVHLDLSDYLKGEDELRVWDLRDDATLTAYDLRLDEDGEFYIDTLHGDWKPFLNQEFQMSESEKEEMSGFSARIKTGFEGIETEIPALNLFGIIYSDMDSEVEFFLNEYSYYELFELDYDSPAMTRAAEMGSNIDDVLDNMRQLLKGGVTRNDIANEENAKEFLKSTLEKLSGRSDDDVFFNPNDDSFTLAKWREQSNIYIYDATGPEKVGDYRFSIVPLPWSGNVTNTNLPFGFCNDVTPNAGWQLVLNYCGSTVTPNTNYFALYNKYTGVLRFFFYMPQQFIANNANDHAWKVIMTDELLQHVNMRYSLPISKNIADKAAIGMNDADASILVTPWVSSKSTDNYVTPKTGWWAFDIDLSLYRPNFHAVNQELRLQMCGWQKDAITLSSTIDAKIKEKVPATTYSFNSLGALSSIVLDGKSPVMDIYSNIAGGKWWDAAKSGLNLAKWGYNIYTSVRDRDNEPSYSVKQYIDGTISTQGLISGSRPIIGFSEPNIPMNKFDIENTTLGQGIWNLKSSPVIYQTDADVLYSYIKYPTVSDPDRPSPLTLFTNPKDYNSAYYCILDPSSVEVVLNPKAFPNDQVEYVDVQSFCGVRKGTTNDTNADYRRAFGMSTNDAIPLSNYAVTLSHTKDNPIPNDNPLYDYLYNSNDKLGYSFPSTFEKYGVDADFEYHLVGRGDADYLLEPVIFACGGSTGKGRILPCYEVTVTVTVKLKDVAKPLVYTRTYLPEIKLLSLSNAKPVVQHVEDYVAKIKKDGQPSAEKGTQLLEIQLNHMKSAFKFLMPDYMNVLTGVTYESTRDGGGYVQYLFDGNPNTEWSSHIAARENGSQWVFEFKASKPITPKKYTMTTSSKWTEYQGANPQLWALNGKDKNGKWVRLDQRDANYGAKDDAMPRGNSLSKTYEIQQPGTYQEFQMVIVNYDGSLSGWDGFLHSESCRCRIAEFRFED